MNQNSLSMSKTTIDPLSSAGLKRAIKRLHTPGMPPAVRDEEGLLGVARALLLIDGLDAESLAYVLLDLVRDEADHQREVTHG